MRTFFSLSHCFSIHVLYAYMYCIHTLHPPSTICVHCALVVLTAPPRAADFGEFAQGFWRIQWYPGWVSHTDYPRLKTRYLREELDNSMPLSPIFGNRVFQALPIKPEKTCLDGRFKFQISTTHQIAVSRVVVHWSHGLLRIMWRGEHSQCRCAPPKHFRGGRFQNCVVECWGHWGGLGLDAFLVLPPGPLRLWWHLHLPDGHQMSLEIAWNLSPGLGFGCWARGQFPAGLKNAMFCWSKTGEPFEQVFPSRGSGRSFAFFTGTLRILPAFFIASKRDLDVHLNDLVALQLLVKSHPSAGHQVVCPSFFAAQWTGRRDHGLLKILVLAGSYGLNDYPLVN